MSRNNYRRDDREKDKKKRYNNNRWIRQSQLWTPEWLGARAYMWEIENKRLFQLRIVLISGFNCFCLYNKSFTLGRVYKRIIVYICARRFEVSRLELDWHIRSLFPVIFSTKWVCRKNLCVAALRSALLCSGKSDCDLVWYSTREWV